MRRIMNIGLTALTALSALCALPTPAKADFGDFLLGVGAAAGTSAVINSNRRAEDKYRPVSPEQEYYRGTEDGINGAKYDNPRSSSDYDKGYEEGLRKRTAASPGKGG